MKRAAEGSLEPAVEILGEPGRQRRHRQDHATADLAVDGDPAVARAARSISSAQRQDDRGAVQQLQRPARPRSGAIDITSAWRSPARCTIADTSARSSCAKPVRSVVQQDVGDVLVAIRPRRATGRCRARARRDRSRIAHARWRARLERTLQRGGDLAPPGCRRRSPSVEPRDQRLERCRLSPRRGAHGAASAVRARRLRALPGPSTRIEFGAHELRQRVDGDRAADDRVRSLRAQAGNLVALFLRVEARRSTTSARRSTDSSYPCSAADRILARLRDRSWPDCARVPPVPTSTWPGGSRPIRAFFRFARTRWRRRRICFFVGGIGRRGTSRSLSARRTAG